MSKFETVSLKRAHPLLRWSAHIFVEIGALALGYFGFVMLDARFFQAYHARRFERALKDSGSSAGSSAHNITAPNAGGIESET